MSDKELFDHLVLSVPEFELMNFVSSDDKYLLIALKEEYAKSEEDILIDITRILQTKFFQ
ncbi:hypothetical protein ES705_47941 [subsurface metagenome]